MQNYLPVLQLPEEAGPQTAPRDKLGGLPWGLRSDMWPVCTQCGGSQSLLAQFVHDPVRLDLGRPGRMLNVFQCNHDPGMCENWEGGAGGNACFVVEPEDLLRGLSEQPGDDPEIEFEATIAEWETQEDGISPEDAQLFFPAPDHNSNHNPTSRSITDFDPTTSTRLGGVPFWMQSPREAPQGGWTFVGQLDNTVSFRRAPTVDHPEVERDRSRWEGRTHTARGPNFGDNGVGYIFLKHGGPLPQGWFFWQCA